MVFILARLLLRNMARRLEDFFSFLAVKAGSRAQRGASIRRLSPCRESAASSSRSSSFAKSNGNAYANAAPHAPFVTLEPEVCALLPESRGKTGAPRLYLPI